MTQLRAEALSALVRYYVPNPVKTYGFVYLTYSLVPFSTPIDVFAFSMKKISSYDFLKIGRSKNCFFEKWSIRSIICQNNVYMDFRKIVCNRYSTALSVLSLT